MLTYADVVRVGSCVPFALRLSTCASDTAATQLQYSNL
jgi:hypothetical protein